MSVLADDNMVMHRDTERPGGFHDRLRHVDVRPRRGGVSGRVVVHQDDGGGGEFERTAHDLAGIDGRVIHRSAALHLICDQRVALVQKEDAKLLARFVGHGGMTVLDDRGPGGEHRLVPDLALQRALGDGGDQLDIERDGLSDAADFLEQGRCRTEDPGKRAEFAEQRFGNGLGVAAGNEAEEEEFEDFIVGKRRIAAFTKTKTKTVTVPVVVLLFRVARGNGGCGPRRPLRKISAFIDFMEKIAGRRRVVRLGGGRGLVDTAARSLHGDP